MSKIEWTDATWSPITGCTWTSPGCDHCYAARMSRRLEAMGQEKYAGVTNSKHFNGIVRLHEHELDKPLKWKKPRMIFVCSMSDLFHKDVPFEFIDKVFAVMALCPQHVFQCLTKRPERMAEYLEGDRGADVVNWSLEKGSRYDKIHIAAHDMPGWTQRIVKWPPPNCWFGTSVENRDELWRIGELRKCPAAVRFLSLEPLLEDLGEIELTGIHWVIVGGESGPGARPMHPDWARSIRDQCAAAGVPLFFKQWGAWMPVEYEAGHWPESHDRYTFEDGQQMQRVGKKAAGRHLDGVEHNGMPELDGLYCSTKNPAAGGPRRGV